jgi:fermentation-respiration switch protein FrsA (DUF1100 family)
MPAWIGILLAGAAAYAGICALVFLFQTRLVYYPSVGRELLLTPKTAGLEYEDVRLAAADGVRLHGWFIPVTAPRGVVLLFHGNAGNISHRLGWLLMFYRLGYSTLIIDYRGYGASEGTPSEQGTYLDAEAAWNHLTGQRGFGERDIVLAGESLGGAVAAWLAARHAPRALVLASAFTSVPDLGAKVYPWLPVRLLARIAYDTRSYLARVRCPVLVAHSRDDEIVPFEQGQTLWRSAPEPKQFIELAGGHNDGFIYTRQQWVDELAAFLERQRLPSAPAAGNDARVPPGAPVPR